jgi:glycosyltransferase involved in cell wall biosynthesis
MDIVHLPAARIKQIETLSHTGLSTVHALMHRRPDVGFVFNAANSPFIPMLRARGIPIALHMDGLEWKRSKWGPRGRFYYRWAEQRGVRVADALIADAPGIADYYAHQFDAPTEMIRYGAPLLENPSEGGVRRLGLEPGGYHLVVARFEPENHVREIVAGFHRSGATKPLVVVGSAPYSADYTRDIEQIAAADDRIRLLGGVWDQQLLDELYAHAFTYVHGHSVGGTNPSLLRAMGAGTAVIAYDACFNREVLGGRGWFFHDSDDLAAHLDAVERTPKRVGQIAVAVRNRAAEAFRWDDVADAYEDLALRLASGQSVHSQLRRARRATAEWPG